MPIKIQNDLPAKKVLLDENIFVMDEKVAVHQDIRELQILILNLMPIKQETEAQILRALSNSPLQIEITLMGVTSHTSKNTSLDHLLSFYVTFDEVKHRKFDGFIITGAPVEHLDFEEVDYWEELKEIMAWSNTNVTSTFHICWGAQAGLYYHYGIPKHPVEEKVFGVYSHQLKDTMISLFRGFDEEFYAPHSRHTTVEREDILKNNDLFLGSESEEAGVYIVVGQGGKHIFVTGHSEYDRYTLHKEYVRDLDKNIPINIPKNYYPHDDINQRPVMKWRSHGNNLYTNWLNYYVYQITPYVLQDVGWTDYMI